MRGGKGVRGKDGPSSEASWTIQSCKSKAKQRKIGFIISKGSLGRAVDGG